MRATRRELEAFASIRATVVCVTPRYRAVLVFAQPSAGDRAGGSPCRSETELRVASGAPAWCAANVRRQGRLPRFCAAATSAQRRPSAPGTASAGAGLPTQDRRIDVGRLMLYREAPRVKPFRRHQRRPGAAKGSRTASPFGLQSRSASATHAMSFGYGPDVGTGAAHPKSPPATQGSRRARPHAALYAGHALWATSSSSSECEPVEAHRSAGFSRSSRARISLLSIASRGKSLEHEAQRRFRRGHLPMSGVIPRFSLFLSLKAGNSAGDRFAPDCVPTTRRC